MSVEAGYERLMEVYEDVEQQYNNLSSALHQGDIPPELRHQTRRTMESLWNHMEELQMEISNWHADYWSPIEFQPSPVRRLNFDDNKGHCAPAA